MRHAFPFPALRRAGLLPLAAALLVAGCNDDDDPVIVTPGDFDPEITEIRTLWVEQGWAGLDPIGSPGVQLFWELPQAWDGEVFRVYSREDGAGDFFLIATVTACANRVCTYTDTNVEPGEAYDYFVVATDDRTGDELGESDVFDVAVPADDTPEVPAGLEAIALDSAVYLRWNAAEAARYRIFLEGLGEDSVFFEIGATDGLGYVDTRAENGTAHTYRIAAVSEAGYVSPRSATISAIPRPDYHAELVFAHGDDPQASGFRFATTQATNPILPGTSADAQWRLEESGGVLRIVPLGDTRVTGGVFTTDLSCGPGSEADCEFVAEAPPATDFGTAPVEVSAGNTYVFRVNVGGQPHFGKVRVQGHAVDSSDRRVVVFDWAYQTVANEPSLNLVPIR